MDSTQRKGINFDLDTEALKEHYSHVFEREAQKLSEQET